MEDRTEALICERSDDLISFLYHELGEREVRNFERHLATCSSCTRELASFKDIRAGVVAWREQTLGLSRISTPEPVALGQPGKRSAGEAIRQFFDLSPVWLKGAVAFASIIFVAAVGFLVINMNASPVVPMRAVEQGYSESELKAKIEEGVQARLKELNAPGQSRQQLVVQAPELVQRPKPRFKSVRSEAKTRRAPLTKSEREQLAADLGLIFPSDDSDLYLWSEQINR